MIKSTLGRVPINQPGLLCDPYLIDKDKNALIVPSENFTISIRTISKQLYTEYKDHYLAGKFGNDYFALVSEMGLGDSETPSLKAHYLTHIDNMTNDIVQNIWAENVAIVEDFQKNKKSLDQTDRLYLSFSSFCQGLGDSTEDQVTKALTEVATQVGGAFPTLVPYTALGEAALQGINNIIKKVAQAKFKPEIKTASIALYSYEPKTLPIIGEAPLQTGSYAFFFEEVDLDYLRMEENAIITSTREQPVSPYIVVNIKKGITLAADQIEKNLAAEVLAAYNKTSSYPVTSSTTSVSYFDVLGELGNTIRLATSVQRYFELNQTVVPLSPAETARLSDLSTYLKANLPDFGKIVGS